MRYALESSDRASFAERGYSRVFAHPLLKETDAAERIMAGHATFAGRLAYPGPTNVDMERRLDEGMTWFQGTFAHLPDLWNVVSHPALVDRVASILGPDLLVWATTVLTKKPDDVHSWHTDMVQWEGVTAFVGLRGMSRGSVVKVMSHTHRLGETPFDLFTTGQFTDALGKTTPLADEALVLAEAQKREPRCELVAHDMTDGDFFLFDNLAWHGSRNTSGITRTALAVFYARPDADIRIPTAFGKTPTWYAKKPPCILVAGVDRFKKNVLVPPPR